MPKKRTIFNTVEIDFAEANKSLTREQLEDIANDQCFKLCNLRECVIELLINRPSPEQVHEIACGMMDTLEDTSGNHEAWYGGKHRERLLKLFPTLGGKGSNE